MSVIDPGYEEPAYPILALRFLRVTGFLKKDENCFLERASEYEEILSEPLADGLEHAESLLPAVQREAHKGAVLTAVLFPALLKGVERNAERIAHQRLVQVALAVERYRKSEKRLPETLRELTPKLLVEIPRDPFDDEEIRYRKDGDGYVVYSVGEDRKDDGGKRRMPRAAKMEHPRGDIVFAVSRKPDRKRQD